MDPNPYLPGATPPGPPPTPPKLVEDGILGPATWKEFQKVLQAEGFYKGRIDGIAGRQTILAMQKALNANAL
jgi:lysozyme family protein